MKIAEIRCAGLRGATPEGGWSSELRPEHCVIPAQDFWVWEAYSPTTHWSELRLLAKHNLHRVPLAHRFLRPCRHLRNGIEHARGMPVIEHHANRAIAERRVRVPQQAHAAHGLERAIFNVEAARRGHAPAIQIPAVEQLLSFGRVRHAAGQHHRQEHSHEPIMPCTIGA